MRDYGVDLSSNNPSDASKYAQYGSKFAIIKLTQGTYYKNPSAYNQFLTAKSSGQKTAGYFYANFSSNSYEANLEAQYAISTAVALGLPKGSVLAVDWETGDGNSTSGNRQANTQAILIAMQVIEHAGYRPLLYAGAYLLNNAVDTSAILKAYPNSLWVASYPTKLAVNNSDFNYFPQMNGVAIWQFTSNWYGVNVDANVMLIDVFNNNQTESEVDSEMAWHPEVGLNELGRFKVNRDGGADMYYDSGLSKIVKSSVDNTFKIFRATNGAVECGTNQWFSQADGLTKINPLAINPHAHALCKIVTDDAWTQNKPADNQAGIKKLDKGTTWNVLGRSGKYLLVGNTDTGLYIDGNKTVIVL